METPNKNDIRYLNTKKRVKQLKRFYIHLGIFVAAFVLSFGIKMLKGNFLDESNFWGFGLWGIGLLVHALTVFLPNFILGSDWEERKIKELMDKNKK